MSELVTYCFKPSQPQTAERTNEAEIRPEVQSEKAESCRENLWNKMQLKEP